MRERGIGKDRNGERSSIHLFKLIQWLGQGETKARSLKIHLGSVTCVVRAVRVGPSSSFQNILADSCIESRVCGT